VSARDSARLAGYPSWLVYVDSVLPVAALYVVHGNIRDLQLIPRGEQVTFQRVPAAIRDMLSSSGMPTVLYHSALHGLSVLSGSDEQAARRALGPHERALGTTPSYADLAEIAARVAAHAPDPVALIIDYLSQTVDAGDPDQVRPLYLELLRIAGEGTAYLRPGGPRTSLRNPVFLLVDQPTDLPPWLVSGDGIRQVPVPLPDIGVRTRAARGVLAGILPEDRELARPQSRAIVDRFRDATQGLTLRALIEVVQISRDADIPAERIEDAVRRYRVGLVEDPWRSPVLVEKLRTGQQILADRVKGQPRAIARVVDILVRSVSGMTAAHHRDRGTGPRGVMFFAGPTGVGKTELAKSIAQLLFGDDEAYTRFDMSEFAQDAADNRLIGSPPGYIGHGHGGELTNAVRDRPFSVLLFDEIEKAHPRVLDKFLQILSDGRLTDGSGDTVYFNEALIVFTSNLGVGQEGTLAEDSAADGAAYEHAVQQAIETAFTEGLHRPELLGRIGDNIVVFDYIAPGTARQIANGYIDNVLARVRRELDIGLTIPDPVRERLLDRVTADLSKGARGVGNNLEAAFVNPLARAVFDAAPGSQRVIADVSDDGPGIATVRLT